MGDHIRKWVSPCSTPVNVRRRDARHDENYAVSSNSISHRSHEFVLGVLTTLLALVFIGFVFSQHSFAPYEWVVAGNSGQTYGLAIGDFYAAFGSRHFGSVAQHLRSGLYCG
jgi:hypothetical protein